MHPDAYGGFTEFPGPTLFSGPTLCQGPPLLLGLSRSSLLQLSSSLLWLCLIFFSWCFVQLQSSNILCKSRYQSVHKREGQLANFLDMPMQVHGRPAMYNIAINKFRNKAKIYQKSSQHIPKNIIYNIKICIFAVPILQLHS